MSAPHTPGPWAVSKPSGNYIDAPAVKGSIAALTFSATPADAALIAAAPDLLAALKKAQEYFDGYSTRDTVKRSIAAAIAKANGEETNA